MGRRHFGKRKKGERNGKRTPPTRPSSRSCAPPSPSRKGERRRKISLLFFVGVSLIYGFLLSYSSSSSSSLNRVLSSRSRSISIPIYTHKPWRIPGTLPRLSRPSPSLIPTTSTSKPAPASNSSAGSASKPTVLFPFLRVYSLFFYMFPCDPARFLVPSHGTCG